MHALAGIDYWVLGLSENLGCSRDVVWRWGCFRAEGWNVLPVVWHVLAENVQWHFDNHRSTPTIAQLKKRAPHDFWGRAAHGQRLYPLRDMLHVERRIEVRIVVGEATWITRWNYQYRHRFRVSLGYAPERVFGARAMLHTEHTDLVAAGQARVSIRHVQADALLAHDDGANVHFGCGFDQRIDRVGEQNVHAFGLHGVSNSVNDFHCLLTS